MPTFSIIVPVYNAEKTLVKCLNSLIAQTDRDFDVHMVENGSTDSSLAICKRYAQQDPRFVLHISATNCGPSAARNIGLDHARGDLIAFLDSDDFVAPDYLSVLRQAFDQADAVFFGYHQISVSGDQLGDHIPHIDENAGYYDTLLQLYEQDLFGYTWIKAFRRHIIGSHRFSQQLNLLEDEVFACDVLASPCKIAVLSTPIHYYVTGNAGSLIGRTHPDYCIKADTAFKAWKQLLAPYEKKDAALVRMANAHVNRCMYYGFERKVDVKAFFTQLAESDFFAQSTLENAFTECIKKNHFRKLARMKAIYRLKIKITKLIKR